MSAKSTHGRDHTRQYEAELPANPLPVDANHDDRVRIMIERVSRGESCFHPDDPHKTAETEEWRVPRGRVRRRTKGVKVSDYDYRNGQGE